MAMRLYMRGKHVEGQSDVTVLDEVELDEAQVEEMYRYLAIADYEDRFVIPTSHREQAIDAFPERGGCGFSFGDGCHGGDSGGSLFGGRKQTSTLVQPVDVFDPRASVRLGTTKRPRRRAMTEAAMQHDESPGGMLSLRVLSRLLDYPSAALQAATDEMIEILDAERRWSPTLRAALTGWCQRLAEDDLMERQAEYVALFDRGRATSLLLFEHVHGESRERGQAMVDLLAEYRAAGFEIDARELPDYLPLFLEYLSTRPEAEIAQWLGEIRHILACLGARLEEREADHAWCPWRCWR